MKKGFTLIELLAVIVILAIIALVATPIVLDVIEDSRKSAINSSLYGIVDAAKYYYAGEYIKTENEFRGYDCTFNNNTGCEKLVIDGKLPEKGNLSIDSNGNVLFALVYDDTCYTKSYISSEIKESDNIDDCKVIIINSNEIQYTNSNTTCENIECALDELYERLGE